MKNIAAEIFSSLSYETIKKEDLIWRPLNKPSFAEKTDPLVLLAFESPDAFGRAVYYQTREPISVTNNVEDNGGLFSIKEALPHIEGLKLNYQSLNITDPAEGPTKQEVGHHQAYYTLDEEDGSHTGVLITFEFCDEYNNTVVKDNNFNSSSVSVTTIPNVTPDMYGQIVDGMTISSYESQLKRGLSKRTDQQAQRILDPKSLHSKRVKNHISQAMLRGYRAESFYRFLAEPAMPPVIREHIKSISYSFLDSGLHVTALVEGEETPLKNSAHVDLDELTNYALKRRYQEGVTTGVIINPLFSPEQKDVPSKRLK